MIDATAYRANETTAKRGIASWRLSNINDPYIFQNQGFPVRTDSVLDLAQILDTMQEERFDYYMGEIGGFTDEEAIFFADVCIDYVDFYQKTFERERVIVPLSTMIAHYVIYRKLLGYNTNFSRLLEIGPGCGYLGFFLRHHAPLEDYSQIESTESFYLLQSHINSHVFGARFAEHAISERALSDHSFYIAKMKWHGDFQYEEQKFIDVPRKPICSHYPWWRLGEVAQRRFDIVSSNANLNEFSREALFQYLSLIRDVLADDGAIIAQCLGGGPRSYDSVFADMKSAGFVPAALVAGDNDPGRVFVVSNAVFVGERHPLYLQYANKAPEFPTLDRDLDFINGMFFINKESPGEKRMLSVTNVLDLIKERIAAKPSTQLIEINRVRMMTAIANHRDNLERNLNASEERRLLAAEKAEAEKRANRLTAELEAFKNSTSWRITKPLRVLPPGPMRIIKRCARFVRR